MVIRCIECDKILAITGEADEDRVKYVMCLDCLEKKQKEQTNDFNMYVLPTDANGL